MHKYIMIPKSVPGLICHGSMFIVLSGAKFSPLQPVPISLSGSWTLLYWCPFWRSWIRYFTLVFTFNYLFVLGNRILQLYFTVHVCLITKIQASYIRKRKETRRGKKKKVIPLFLKKLMRYFLKQNSVTIRSFEPWEQLKVVRSLSIMGHLCWSKNLKS